jgi:hypothetical protein
MNRQQEEFTILVSNTSDLPIKLTAVRLFDILCWTAEKWDIRRKLADPLGTPNKSLLNLIRQKEAK